MKYRKKIYGILLVCVLLMGFSVKGAFAQFMPVVFDRTYGDNTDYQFMCPAPAGEIILVGGQSNNTTVTWIKRTGDVLFSRSLPSGFTAVNNVYSISGNRVLIIGQANIIQKGKKTQQTQGRAVVVDNGGNVTTDVYLGSDGSGLTCGELLNDGSLILGGYESSSNGDRIGMIGKISSTGKVIYKYIAAESGTCVDFKVLGSSSDFIHAAFSGDNGEVASIVRLDSRGHTVFVTNLPDLGFNVKKISTEQDGFTYLIGSSAKTGGRIIKLRPEGDIVFNKEIVPASQSASIENMFISNSGNILVGGNDKDRSYYSLLRNDGTDLQKYIMQGNISGIGMNVANGESVIAGYDKARSRGTIIGLSKDGSQIYQKSTDGNFDKVNITSSGVLLASSAAGRVCMISNLGDLLFDRYVLENTKEAFQQVAFTTSGEILFSGMQNRLVKLAHGVYVSDVKVNKPVDGYTTATFTITLTGYATSDLGTPLPVTLEYATREGTATEANNYTPLNGSLSFVPSNDGSNRYMVKQEVDVPIKSNSLLEGSKSFELELTNIRQSYMIKPLGSAVVEDQEALVRFVKSEDGLEGVKDVVFELGLFKTNGDPLVNATGSDIIIDGYYGKGTADALDFDMSVMPYVKILKGAKGGRFSVKTLVDTRYELPKTVVINFNNINTISTANVSFNGAILSCMGKIIDQPAMLAINSLGNHGRLNNTVSGFFRISLIRASDGVLLTNATGSDINISCSVPPTPTTTAVEGRDFVLTNLYDLRIWGDGNNSTVNLNGIVLYNPESKGTKKLYVKIDSVTVPQNAPAIKIATDNKVAGFTIE